MTYQLPLHHLLWRERPNVPTEAEKGFCLEVSSELLDLGGQPRCLRTTDEADACSNGQYLKKNKVSNTLALEKLEIAYHGDEDQPVLRAPDM
jgi:hypothetical protein